MLTEQQDAFLIGINDLLERIDAYLRDAGVKVNPVKPTGQHTPPPLLHPVSWR